MKWKNGKKWKKRKQKEKIKNRNSDDIDANKKKQLCVLTLILASFYAKFLLFLTFIPLHFPISLGFSEFTQKNNKNIPVNIKDNFPPPQAQESCNLGLKYKYLYIYK